MTRTRVVRIGASLTVLVAVLSSTAVGQTVDFEQFALDPGSQINFAAGESWNSGGFTFTPGPDPNSNESHVANAVDSFAYNGTHVGIWHRDMVLTRAGGGPFDLVSFDLAGFPTDFEVAFSVTAQPGGAVANFTPDGLVDGPGGVADFETFVLSGGFTNITSATWVHTGAGTLAGVFALDNIVVPEPAAFFQVLAGALGLMRRRR